MIGERGLWLNLRMLSGQLSHQNRGSRLHFVLVPVGGISALYHSGEKNVLVAEDTGTCIENKPKSQ